MSQFRASRPSPALVISIIALFVALGGSAYAASKIGTKNIKSNAITAAKIKKNAVTSAKIKKDAVTGAKINEATLGAVPTAVNATNSINFSRYSTTGLKKAALGQTIQLGAVGPFVIYGRCTPETGGITKASTFITTTQPNSSMNASNDEFYEFDFGPGQEAEIGDYASSTGPYWETEDYDALWYAISGDGGTIVHGVAANGVNALGANCIYNVNWIVDQ